MHSSHQARGCGCLTSKHSAAQCFSSCTLSNRGPRENCGGLVHDSSCVANCQAALAGRPAAGCWHGYWHVPGVSTSAGAAGAGRSGEVVAEATADRRASRSTGRSNSAQGSEPSSSTYSALQAGRQQQPQVIMDYQQAWQPCAMPPPPSPAPTLLAPEAKHHTVGSRPAAATGLIILCTPPHPSPPHSRASMFCCASRPKLRKLKLRKLGETSPSPSSSTPCPAPPPSPLIGVPLVVLPV